MTAIYRLLYILLFPLVRIMFRVKVEGRENIPTDRAVMLCCNHTAISDIFLLIRFFPRQIYFMAKQEAFSFPPFKWILKNAGAFPVKRGGNDIGAVRLSCRLLNKGKDIGIFPEGTRHRSGPPHDGKTGSAYIAMRAGCDVLPASIYKEKLSPLFCRATLRFGNPININEAVTGDKPTKTEVSVASERIMSEIISLWELGF